VSNSKHPNFSGDLKGISDPVWGGIFKMKALKPKIHLRRTKHLLSTVLLLYVLLVALASKDYGEKTNAFLEKSAVIFKQLERRNPSQAKKHIPTKKTHSPPRKPNFFLPQNLFASFIRPENIYGQNTATLKKVLIAFKANLSELDLSHMDLSGGNTDLSFANLSHANLSAANLHKTNLIHAKLKGANLKGATLTGTQLDFSDLSHADLRDASLRGAILPDAKLKKADLSNTNLRGALLKRADLREVNFFYADLQGADLNQAHLMGVTLSGADLRKVNFQKADLSGAVMGGARLDGADLTDAKLNGADLRYADLSKTIGLKEDQLVDVQTDENTKLPEGLEVKIDSQGEIE